MEKESKEYPIGSLEADLIDEAPEISSEELMKYGKDPQSGIKVLVKDCPVYPYISLVDVSINASGKDEDSVYALNPDLQKNIRRGNTYIEVYDSNDYNLYKYIKLARRGLMKFYDMKTEYLVTDEDFRLRFKPETARSKNHAKIQEMHSESNLRNYIFSGVMKSLNDKAYVEVVKSLKINGENAQISWVKEEQVWCIASKNVGILAANRSDLEYYGSKSTTNRYYYAVMIAHTWFDTLEYIKKKGIYISKLSERLANRTMVGEYIGNPYHQHLIKYSRETICFYAIVDNLSNDKNCLLPEESYEIFNEFGLDCVPCETIGVFDNIDSLSDALFNEHKLVSQATIKSEEEGAVLYMIRRGLNDDKVVSLSKLKTLEYRIFRKLREKLRNFWSRHENITSWNDNLQAEYDKSFNLFIKESRELTKGFNLPHKMQFYEEFADRAYNVVQKDFKSYEKLCNFYVDFLESISKEFNYDQNIFRSQIFSNRPKKYYVKTPSKELKVDNDSWESRKSNTSYFEKADNSRNTKASYKQTSRETNSSTTNALKSGGKTASSRPLNSASNEMKKQSSSHHQEVYEEATEEEIYFEETTFIKTKAVTFIISLTIPGSGKTKLKDELINELSSKESEFDEKIKFLHLSSDDIRAELVTKRMEETKETREKAFDSTQKQASKQFSNRLDKIVDEIIEDKENYGFAVFLDKNVLPNQFESLKKQLASLKEKLSTENIRSKVIGLIPEWMRCKEDDPNHPFSYNYLLQTYLRTHLRKNHPTIVQGEWHLKPVQISCFFFKQFNKVEFKEQENKLICIDHKTNVEMEFDEFQYITFTCESEFYAPPQSFIDCTNQIMKHQSKSAMWDDEMLLEHFYNCVEFYRDAFSFKEGDYNNRDVKAVISLIDTKGPDLKLVRRKPMKVIGNKSSFRHSSRRLLNDEKNKIDDLKSEDSNQAEETKEVKSNKSNRNAKLIKKSKFAKTQEEIMQEEELQEKVNKDLDQQVFEDLIKDGFKVVKTKDYTKVKNKLNYYSIVYIGLKVEEDDPNEIIDDFVKLSLSKLSQKFENLKLLADNVSEIQSLGWKRPVPPYHITSLFVNRLKENIQKECYKKFKEGIYEQCAIKGFVMVEDYIMTSLVFPVSIPVENKVPHLTLYIKDGKPFDSNMVLENLIIQNKNRGGKSLSEDIIRNFFRDHMNNPDMQTVNEEIRHVEITLPREKKKRNW